jgi:hypothetical protein
MDATGAGGLARNLRNPALPEKVEADLSLTELTAARSHGSQLTLDQAVSFVIETLRNLAIGDRSAWPSLNHPGVVAQD